MTPLVAQDRMDSIKRLLPKVHDSVKVTILHELSLTAPDGEWQQFNQELKQLTLRHIRSKEKGEKRYLESYAIALGNDAFDYVEKGDYAKAIGAYQECAAIQIKLEAHEELSLTYSNIGALYDRDGDLLKAIEYNKKALSLQKEKKNYATTMAALNNLASLYTKQSDTIMAKATYLLAYDIIRQYNPRSNATSLILSNLGSMYRRFHQLDSAILLNRMALKIASEMGNVKGLGGAYESMGKVFAEENQEDSAIIYFTKGFEIAQKNHYVDDLRDISQELYSLHKKNDKNDKALFYLEERNKADKELKSDENKRAIIKFQVDNEYAVKKAADSVSFAKAAAINELQLQKERILNKSIEQEKVVQSLTIQKTKSDLLLEQGRRNSQEKQLAITKKEKELLRSENEVARLNASRNRSILWGLCLVLVVLTLVARIFYIQNVKRKRINLALREEKEKSETLLLNILPAEVADELKQRGMSTARHFDEVTVLFTDFVEFTRIGERMSPQVLVQELHECFSAFDQIVDKYNLEKIKTVGDAYIAVCGLPVPNKLHAINTVEVAGEIRAFMAERKKQGKGFEIRIGIHTGPVVAGIVGVKKFAYDIWGDTVNTASRMESSGEAGKINISESTYELVKDKFVCIHRGKVSAKGKGEMEMYFVDRRKG